MGKPCKNGVLGMRVSSRCKCEKCVEGVRAKDRERYELREKQRRIAYQNSYYEANKEVCNARNKEYRSLNAERLNKMDRDWYHANKEIDNARRIAHYVANKPATRLRIHKWYVENREVISSKKALHLAERAKRDPCWAGELDDLVFVECIDLAEKRRAATGLKWEVDHMMPLLAKRVSGLHVWNNMQVIPQAMNRAKKNKEIFCNPMDWLRHA